MNNKKTIVVHPYQQHSYKTAVAVKKMGLLDRYITSVYDKEGSITRFIKNFLKNDNLKKANNRHENQLSDNDVLQFCEFTNLILLFLANKPKLKSVHTILNRFFFKRFNSKVYKYIRKNNVNNVIVYDLVSYDLIKKIKHKCSNVTIILDMSAPYFLYMDMMFKKAIDVHGKTNCIYLYNELNSKTYKQKKEMAEYEVNNSDYFFVASEFTRNSLIKYGIDGKKCFKCVYGIYSFPEAITNEKKLKLACKVQVIFIGAASEKKGFIEFSKVTDLLGTEKFEFNVLGSFDLSDPLYIENKKKIKFWGHIPHDDVKTVLEKMDIIIFPSLADGFGFSVVEAMQYGVVPIVSRNAGVSDIISNGINGFLVDVFDANKMANYCMDISSNSELKSYLKSNAIKSAQSLRWDIYFKDVKKALDDICKI